MIWSPNWWWFQSWWSQWGQIYAKATELYNNKQFKDAYYSFNKIAQIDEQYKDAVKMRTTALQQATAIVGVLPLQVNTLKN